MSVYSSERQQAAVTNGYGGSDINKNVRNSTLFFPQAQDFPKTFTILQSIIIEEYGHKIPYISCNNIAEIQYARYDQGNYFKKHKDVIERDDKPRRALTFSINLTDGDLYGNGELVVYDDDKNEIARLDKEIGSYIIFPAFFSHEACEVTNGTREAIVTWIHSEKPMFDKFYEDFYARRL